MVLSKWLGDILYPLVEETEIVRLVGGKYTSYSQGKAEWKSSFSV